MASIDNIWDAPVTPNSPKTPRHLDTDEDDVELQRPSKRQRQALFLSDSEDEGGEENGIRRGVVRAPPPTADPDLDGDVEAMFADAENDEGLSFKKIGDMDVAAMEREAEERHRRATPLTPHSIVPSSSPVRDSGTSGNGGGGSQNNNKGKDGKKRPRAVLLNENLLLGPSGFPDLISQIEGFTVKGKGREAEDLARLMRVYNFWTHKLHPRLKFYDTVVRIEKLCHTKRMQVALSVWRDEAHGKTHELDADLSLNSDEDSDQGGRINPVFTNKGSGDISSEAPTTPHSGRNTDQEGFSLPPSSRASSLPPTSDFPDDDDLFGPSTSPRSRPSGSSSMSTSVAAEKGLVVEDDDEEESLWKELEASKTLQQAQRNQQQSKSQPTSVQSVDDSDEAEMWAALDEVTNRPSVPSGNAMSGNSRADSEKADGMGIDDDDMCEIIRENEKTALTRHSPAKNSTTAIAVSAHKPTQELSVGGRPLAESEMDWDDMYAD